MAFVYYIWWKLGLLKRRNWLFSIVELVWPVLLVLVSCYIEREISTNYDTEKSLIQNIEYENVADGAAAFGGINYLYYYPTTDQNDALVRRVQEKLELPTSFIRTGSDIESLRKQFSENVEKSFFVEFANSSAANVLNYKLMVSGLRLPNRLKQRDGEFQVDQVSPYTFNLQPIFQFALESSFIERLASFPSLRFDVQMSPMPAVVQLFKSEYYDSIFNVYLIVCMLLVLPVLISFVILRGNEYATKIDYLLHVGGVSPWKNEIGWFVYLGLPILIISLGFCFANPFLSVPSRILFAPMFLLYGIALAFQFILITKLFQNLTVALLFGFAFHFITLFCGSLAIQGDAMYEFKGALMVLIPNFNIANVLKAMVDSDRRNDTISGGLVVLNMTLSLGHMGLCLCVYSLNSAYEKREWNKLSPQWADDEEQQHQGALNPKYIKVANVDKKFGSRWALDDVSFEIEKNKITSLLGHNGAGKSTIMAIIAKLLKPSSGSVLHAKEEDIKIGICLQENVYYSEFTVYENLKLFSLMRTNDVDDFQIECILLRLNLTNYSGMFPHQLSGGNLRKLSIAIAFIGSYDFIIFDEPTAGIDEQSRKDVWNMILSSNYCKTILVSTHFMEEAEILSDKIIFINGGRNDMEFELSDIQQGPQFANVIVESEFIGGGTDEVYFTNLFASESQSCTLKTSRPNKLTFEIVSDNVPNILKQLQQLQEEEKISSYGVNTNQLEAIFLDRLRDTGSIFDCDELTATERPCVFNSLIIKKMQFFRRIIYSMCVTILIFAMILITSGCLVSISSRTKFLQSNILFHPEIDTMNVKASFDKMTKVLCLSNSTDGGFMVSVPAAAKSKDLLTMIESTGNEQKIFYNSSYTHSIPASLNYYFNLVAKSIDHQASISFELEPQQFGSWNPDKQLLLILSTLVLPFAILVFLLQFTLFPFNEMVSGFYDLQIFQGIPAYQYWTSSLFIDSIIVAPVPIVLTMLFSSWLQELLLERQLELLLLLQLYCISCLAYGYLLARLFKNLLKICGLCLIAFIFGTVIGFVFVGYESSIKENVWIQLLVVFTSIFNPHIMFQIGLSDYVPSFRLSDMGESKYFAGTCTMLAVIIVLYLGFLILYNSYSLKLIKRMIFKTIKPTFLHCNNVLKVDGVSKRFGSKQILDDINLQINAGESVGLLGENGAGKSTLLKIVTKQLVPDSGDVYINGFNNETHDRLSEVGYCPQETALNLELSAFELVSFVGKIKGISYEQTLHKLFQFMGLQEIMHKPCKTYSKGMMRKVSFILSILGLPSLVIIDEPTTGLDPLSRRKLWSLIEKIKSCNGSFWVVSHYVEECEELCGRLIVLGKGKIIGASCAVPKVFNKCFGSIKTKDLTLSSLVRVAFPDTKIDDSHLGVITFVTSAKLPDVYNFYCENRQKISCIQLQLVEEMI